MEVIQLEDDDDDFIHSVNPTAPRKPATRKPSASSSKGGKLSNRRPPPISTRIDSDPILKESSSSTTIDEDECPICGRDLKLLNEQRRTLHLNSCLDNGEAKAELDKNMEKWRSTMDCPVCKTPLAAGPFRSAHIKKCGREHAINGRDLLQLVNTQEKVAETRRKRALPHTSAKTPKLRPKKVSKLDGEPKSLAEEEMLMAKALSASMMEPDEVEEEEKRKKEKEKEKEKVKKGGQIGGVSPVFTRIINENIRKRRSYAVVELAPRGCRCDVLELIQSRFLRVFRARNKVLKRVEERRKKKGGDEEEEEKKEEEGSEEKVKEHLTTGEQHTLDRVHMEAVVAGTLSRLDSLSWSYRSLAVEGEKSGDVSIQCTDGEIRAFAWSLRARTTALGRVVSENEKFSLSHPLSVVRHWLQYVSCARVEWTAGEENEAMREIARQHGPEGLAEECARLARTRREYRGFGGPAARLGLLYPEDTVATVPTVPPEEKEEVVAVEEEKEASDDSRDTVPPAAATVPQGQEEEEEASGGTLDSEGSLSEALKSKCAARGRAAARLSAPKPRPLADDSFLAFLDGPAAVVTVAATTPPPTVPPKPDTPKDSFFDSIVFAPTPKGNTVPPAATVPPVATTVVEEESTAAESMDESEAMRNILDVSCLRRSPRIRVSTATAGDEEEERKDDEDEEEKRKEEEDRRKQTMLSPELFGDDDDSLNGDGDGGRMEQMMSQRVPSPPPPPRRSPRRSLSQSILPTTVTPTTSRPSRSRLPAVGGGQKKHQEVIVLDDTPVSSPVTVAARGTVAPLRQQPTVASIAKKEEEESTVDESCPRVDQPSYGQGGLDTVEGVEEMEEGGVEEEEQRDAPIVDGGEGGGDDFNLNDDDNMDYYYEDYPADYQWDNNGDEGVEGGGEGDGETDPSMAARAQEEVDSFLQSLRFNETRGEKTAPRQPPAGGEETDSFLRSMRMVGGVREGRMEEEEEEERGTDDILAALSPVKRKEPMEEDDDASPARRNEGDEEMNAFKTPTVREGRGRGREARGGGGFGSHVKVLKWSNVTPRPSFEAMDDATLKSQLARYGLRPMGRKRAIAMLSDIYEQTHPVVDEGAAAATSSTAAAASSSRSCSSTTTSASATSTSTVSVGGEGGGGISPTRKRTVAVAMEQEEEEEENDGERTLNRGVDSSFDDNDDDIEQTGEAEESMVIPKAAIKGADNQLVLFLDWLRAPPQKALYDHCLALKSISLEELEVKLKRADSALCGISKKVLMCVLDRLHITYSVSQDGWKRKRKGK